MAWRQILVENKAVIIQRGWTPLGEEFIYRQFPAISAKAKDDCLVGLKGYTSTKNAEASSFVTDPLVNDEKQVGVWYGGEITVKFDTPDPANPRAQLSIVLVQMLIRGLSAAVAAAVTTEKSCRWTVTRTEFRSMITFPTIPAATTGVSYRFLDARLDDKSKFWSGFLETRTQTAQSIDAFKATIEPFRTVEKSARIGVSDATAAALIPATQTAGKRVSVDLDRNDNCTVDLVKSEETAVAGTRRTTTVEQADVKIVETELLNQTKEVSAPTAEAGKVKTSADTLNEFNRHDHNVRVEEAKDQSIAMPAAYTDAGNVSRTPRQLSRTQIIDGSENPPTPMSTGQYGTVSYSLDRFGVYRGYKTLIEYLEEQELVGWAVTTNKLTLNYLDRSQRGKQFFVRNIYFDCYIKQVSSRAAAYSHAYGDKDGNISLQGTEVGSSRVEVLRNGQYRAFWIGNRIPDAWRTDGSALPI